MTNGLTELLLLFVALNVERTEKKNIPTIR